MEHFTLPTLNEVREGTPEENYDMLTELYRKADNALKEIQDQKLELDQQKRSAKTEKKTAVREKNEAVTAKTEAEAAQKTVADRNTILVAEKTTLIAQKKEAEQKQKLAEDKREAALVVTQQLNESISRLQVADAPERTIVCAGDMKGRQPIDKYFGPSSTSWTTWRKATENILELNAGDPERIKTRQIMGAMAEGPARDATAHIDPGLYQTSKEILDALGELFEPPHATEVAKCAFDGVSQRQNETILDYSNRMRSMFIKAYPAQNPETSDMLVRSFNKGLISDQVKEAILRNSAVTYREAIREAMKEAAIMHRSNLNSNKLFIQPATIEPHFSPVPKSRFVTMPGTFGPGNVNAIGGRRQRGRKRFASRRQRPSSENPVYCDFHKSDKHSGEDCRARKPRFARSKSRNLSSRRGGNFKARRGYSNKRSNSRRTPSRNRRGSRLNAISDERDWHNEVAEATEQNCFAVESVNAVCSKFAKSTLTCDAASWCMSLDSLDEEEKQSIKGTDNSLLHEKEVYYKSEEVSDEVKIPHLNREKLMDPRVKQIMHARTRDGETDTCWPKSLAPLAKKIKVCGVVYGTRIKPNLLREASINTEQFQIVDHSSIACRLLRIYTVKHDQTKICYLRNSAPVIEGTITQIASHSERLVSGYFSFKELVAHCSLRAIPFQMKVSRAILAEFKKNLIWNEGEPLMIAVTLVDNVQKYKDSKIRKNLIARCEEAMRIYTRLYTPKQHTSSFLWEGHKVKPISIFMYNRAAYLEYSHDEFLRTFLDSSTEKDSKTQAVPTEPVGPLQILIAKCMQRKDEDRTEHQLPAILESTGTEADGFKTCPTAGCLSRAFAQAVLSPPIDSPYEECRMWLSSHQYILDLIVRRGEKLTEQYINCWNKIKNNNEGGVEFINNVFRQEAKWLEQNWKKDYPRLLNAFINISHRNSKPYYDLLDGTPVVPAEKYIHQRMLRRTDPKGQTVPRSLQPFPEIMDHQSNGSGNQDSSVREEHKSPSTPGLHATGAETDVDQCGALHDNYVDGERSESTRGVRPGSLEEDQAGARGTLFKEQDLGRRRRGSGDTDGAHSSVNGEVGSHSTYSEDNFPSSRNSPSECSSRGPIGSSGEEAISFRDEVEGQADLLTEIERLTLIREAREFGTAELIDELYRQNKDGTLSIVPSLAKAKAAEISCRLAIEREHLVVSSRLLRLVERHWMSDEFRAHLHFIQLSMTRNVSELNSLLDHPYNPPEWDEVDEADGIGEQTLRQLERNNVDAVTEGMKALDPEAWEKEMADWKEYNKESPTVEIDGRYAHESEPGSCNAVYSMRDSMRALDPLAWDKEEEDWKPFNEDAEVERCSCSVNALFPLEESNQSLHAYELERLREEDPDRFKEIMNRKVTLILADTRQINQWQSGKTPLYIAEHSYQRVLNDFVAATHLRRENRHLKFKLNQAQGFRFMQTPALMQPRYPLFKKWRKSPKAKKDARNLKIKQQAIEEADKALKTGSKDPLMSQAQSPDPEEKAERDEPMKPVKSLDDKIDTFLQEIDDITTPLGPSQGAIQSIDEMEKDEDFLGLNVEMPEMG